MNLPVIASAEDVIQIVQFFKTRATGSTIEDAKVVIDKKLLDPRKINAYLIWGFIIRDGEKLRLSELGKQLALNIANSAEIFSRVLQSIQPYHSALEWIFYKKDIKTITNTEIAAYWYETKVLGMSDENENTLKDMAICFFRVCEAVEIGKLFIGRHGQSTRLEISRDSLGQYIGGSTLSTSSSSTTEETIVESDLSAEVKTSQNVDSNLLANKDNSLPQNAEPSMSSDDVKIFISHGKNMEIVEQIKAVIELANLDYEIAVENETAAIPIPEKVFGAMRRCNSAVICVSADENEKKDDGSYGINQNVLIEIGSAFVLYDKKVILVWDKRISVPSNLQGLYRCEFSGDELGWGTGIKLMKALSSFRKSN